MTGRAAFASGLTVRIQAGSFAKRAFPGRVVDRFGRSGNRSYRSTDFYFVIGHL
jgi:hypothetical protein